MCEKELPEQTKHKYLTTFEVSKMFGVTPQTIRNWIRKGKIKGKKVGHLWLIKAENYNASKI